MIKFTNVTKMYGKNVGLENVSVDIEDGGFVFLVGPSGAGKSTFIKLILKEIDADQGTIQVGDFTVTGLPSRKIPQLRRKIGMVFQDFRLLQRKTVFENVAFAMEIMHKSRRQIRQRVPQVLELVGIGDKGKRYPQELSAGEQQRVAIARAIISNPEIILADEATGNLDSKSGAEIMDLFRRINQEKGITILQVTHSRKCAEYGTRTVILENGKTIDSDSLVVSSEKETSRAPMQYSFATQRGY